MSSQIMKNNAQKWLFCSMKLYALKLFSNKGGKLSCFFFRENFSQEKQMSFLWLAFALLGCFVDYILVHFQQIHPQYYDILYITKTFSLTLYSITIL